LTAEQETLRPLRESVTRLEREYTLLSNSVNQMEQIIETKTSWSQALRTLSECMDTNVWVRQLQVSTRQRRNTLTITARAVTLEDYMRFKDALGKSTRFENINVPTTTRQADDSTEFVITCEVLPDYKYIERLMEKKARIMDVMKQPAVQVLRAEAAPVQEEAAVQVLRAEAAPVQEEAAVQVLRAEAAPVQEETLQVPGQTAGVPRVPPIGLALTNLARPQPSLSQPPVTTP